MVQWLGRWCITFVFIHLTWILFRAENIDHAWLVFEGIASIRSTDMPTSWSPLLGMALLLALQAMQLRRRWLHFFESHPRFTLAITLTACVLFPLVFMGVPNPEFIYFQF